MLAQLEHLDLLKPDSEVKNLGFIMALYIKLAATEDILDLEDVTDEIKKNNGTDETFTFVRSNFPSHILAYAKKYNIIKLVGPTDIDEVVEDLEDGAELPERDEKPFGDPWNLSALPKSTLTITPVTMTAGKGGKLVLAATPWTLPPGVQQIARRRALTVRTPSVRKNVTPSRRGWSCLLLNLPWTKSGGFFVQVYLGMCIRRDRIFFGGILDYVL